MQSKKKDKEEEEKVTKTNKRIFSFCTKKKTKGKI